MHMCVRYEDSVINSVLRGAAHRHDDDDDDNDDNDDGRRTIHDSIGSLA